jgi:hypothetical protein
VTCPTALVSPHPHFPSSARGGGVGRKIVTTLSNLAQCAGCYKVNCSHASRSSAGVQYSIQIESNQFKSNQIKSNQFKSNQIKSNQIESNQIKSNQIKSIQFNSIQMKSISLPFYLLLIG